MQFVYKDVIWKLKWFNRINGAKKKKKKKKKERPKLNTAKACVK
jgi:hypothetical protein